LIKEFLFDEEGQSLVEFALVMALFTMASLATVFAIGGVADTQLSGTTQSFQDGASVNLPSYPTLN
jgi:Flp pilus assembly pilin Flp